MTSSRETAIANAAGTKGGRRLHVPTLLDNSVASLLDADGLDSSAMQAIAKWTTPTSMPRSNRRLLDAQRLAGAAASSSTDLLAAFLASQPRNSFR